MACEARLGPREDDELFVMGWEAALTVHEKNTDANNTDANNTF